MIDIFYKTDDGQEFGDFNKAMYHERSLIEQQTNQAQELMFELMKLASFNGFNGEYVVSKLKKRPDLWRAAVMDSDGKYYLIRDLDRGLWHVDTLYLLPKEGQKDSLKKYCISFSADEIGWVKKDNLEVLSLWWD